VSRLVIAVALAGVVLGVASARADIMTTVNTDADAWIGDGANASPKGNHGGDARLAVHRSNGVAKAYLHFDLSGLSAALPVTDARLKVDLDIGQYGSSNVALFAIMDEAKDWNLAALTESGIDETNAPQANLGNQDFLAEGDQVSSVTRYLDTMVDIPGDNTEDVVAAIDIDVTGLIQWVLGQEATYSDFSDTDDCLTVVFRIERDYCFPKFASKETGKPGLLPPRLEVSQVPEPATAAVLCLGLAGLSAIRRRRR